METNGINSGWHGRVVRMVQFPSSSLKVSRQGKKSGREGVGPLAFIGRGIEIKSQQVMLSFIRPLGHI